MTSLVMKFKHSDYYYARFMIDGKMYQKTTKTKNKKDAVQIAEAFRKKVLLDLNNITSNSISIQDAIELYRKTKPNDDKFNFVCNYHLKWLTSNNFEIANLIITLTPEVLQKIATLRTNEGKSPGTVKHTVDFFSRVIKNANKSGYSTPEHNPPKIINKRKKIRYLTSEEEQKILQLLDPTREVNGITSYNIDQNNARRADLQNNYDLFICLLDTGCRLNEIAKLKWVDVNLKFKQISIYRTKVSNEGILSMSDRVFEIFSRRFKNKNSEWVFTNSKGEVKDSFAGIRTAIKKAGCEDATIHTLRHTAATRLVNGGLDIYQVSNILGHSNINQTTKYAHLSNTTVSKKAANVLNNFNNPKQSIIEISTDDSDINSGSVLDSL